MRIATNIYVCVNLAYLRISRAVRSKRVQRSQTSRHHLSFLARPALYLPTDLRALTCLLPWLYRDLLLLLVYTLSRSRRATRETTGPYCAYNRAVRRIIFSNGCNGRNGYLSDPFRSPGAKGVEMGSIRWIVMLVAKKICRDTK